MVPARKLLPAIVTVAPPALDPPFGEIPEMAGAGAIEILREKSIETEVAFESLAAIVNANAPAKEGIPAIVPVEELRVSPLGSRPCVMLHV